MYRFVKIFDSFLRYVPPLHPKMRGQDTVYWHYG